MEASTLATLQSLYAHPSRHYHTFTHITHLLSLFEVHKHILNDPLSVQLAIYFHDAHYDATSTDPGSNERASVALFLSSVPSLIQPPPINIQKVSSLILSTISHSPSEDADEDTRFFLDVDLFVLASPPTEYCKYARDIRKEYAHLSDQEYRAGRISVLSSFLKRDKIYISSVFKDSDMEEKARMNIQREIASLTDQCM